MRASETYWLPSRSGGSLRSGRHVGGFGAPGAAGYCRVNWWSIRSGAGAACGDEESDHAGGADGSLPARLVHSAGYPRLRPTPHRGSDEARRGSWEHRSLELMVMVDTPGSHRWKATKPDAIQKVRGTLTPKTAGRVLCITVLVACLEVCRPPARDRGVPSSCGPVAGPGRISREPGRGSPWRYLP